MKRFLCVWFLIVCDPCDLWCSLVSVQEGSIVVSVCLYVHQCSLTPSVSLVATGTWFAKAVAIFCDSYSSFFQRQETTNNWRLHFLLLDLTRHVHLLFLVSEFSRLTGMWRGCGLKLPALHSPDLVRAFCLKMDFTNALITRISICCDIFSGLPFACCRYF